MNNPFFEHAGDPVDPKLFAFAVELFHAAASGLDREAMGPDVKDLLCRANASEASGQ